MDLKKEFINLLPIGILIGLVSLYTSLRILDLFFYTIILELIVLSFVLLTYSFQRDKIEMKYPSKRTSFILLLFVIFFLIFFSNLLMIIFLILPVSIFLLGIWEKISRTNESRLYTFLLVFLIILIGSTLVTTLLNPRVSLVSLTIIIGASISFVFINVLNELKTVEGITKSQKSHLEEKIAEIFDEKFCDFHTSAKISKTCPKCGIEICDLCLIDYESSCIYCYRCLLENRMLVGDFLQKLGILIVFLFLIFYILGLFAPLPLVQSTISWLGLVYPRFTILIYFISISLILSIMLIGGGTQLSSVINLKIKNIDLEISNLP